MARLVAVFLTLCLTGSVCRAHYNMLMPATPFAKKGDKVEFIYQWGHPFEHELFDAPLPARLFVLLPDGNQQDLAHSLEKTQVRGADKKMVTAYRFAFTPEQRGDHTFMVTTTPIFLAETREFVQDVVKVVLHVSTQKAWDVDPPRQFRIVPLTRPYGLLPGMAFQAQVFQDQAPAAKGAPFKSGLVEYERYNAAPPTKLPVDELITFKTKTDVQGVFTISFPQGGWWCVTAQREAGTRDHEGMPYPLRQRVSLWLHVDEKP